VAGKYSRNKGQRFERELVNLMRDYGIKAKRISMMETGGIDKGDVQIEQYRCEVKGGAQVPKFIYTARKTDEKLLFMRRDGKKWLVCMDMDLFMDKFFDVAF